MKHFIPIIITFLLLTLTTPSCYQNYQYSSPDTGICLPCSYNCLTCYDADYCLQCMSQYYLNQNNTCSKCSFGCSVCTTSTTCTTCNSGLYLTNSGSCIACDTGVATCTIAVIQTCQSTYFLLSTICAGCFTNCDTCSDFVTCSSCKLGYYLSSDSSNCVACPANCLICTDAATCTACVKGYTQNNGLCQLFNCASFDPFCIACTSSECLVCQQGKYLNDNFTCSQSASLLCLQSKGQYNTNCQTSDFGCPTYAAVQVDQNGNQLPVCLPYSATKTQQFIYIKSENYSCSSSTCSQPSTISLTYSTSQAYYRITYYLNIRFYGTTSTRTLFISLVNSNGTVSNHLSQSVNLAKEIGTFNDLDSNCFNCKFSQQIVTGTLLLSHGEYNTNITLNDNDGQFQIMQAMFQHQICQVSHCSSCTSAIDCYACFSPYYLQLTSCVQSCDSGFYVYGKTCYLQCPVGTYTLSSTYSCAVCVSPCLTCGNESICLTCVSGYFLQGSSCLSVCTSTFLFANTTSRNCQSCPNPCVRCTFQNSSISCLSCAAGYLYNGGSCIFMCPWGSYGSFVNGTSTCLNCSSSCSSCYIDNSVCSSCSSGFLLLDTNCQSISTCPASYYINNTYNICVSCHYPCATCLNNPTFCTSCLKGSLYNNFCLGQCPQTFYSNYNNPQNTTCASCPAPCSNCLGINECISCVNGYYLYQTTCLTTCPILYYPQGSNSTCTQCIPPCKICINTTACLSCTTGYLDNTTCTLQCNSTAYINSNFSCALCPTPCISCYSATYCLLCSLPYLLYSQECINKTQCQNITGYYPQYLPNATLTTYATCSSCAFPCLSCLNNSVTCTTCSNGYLYIPNLYRCQTACPSTYFLNGSICSACNSNCYQCNNTATNCTSCSAGMYLDPAANTCVSSCPNQYYSDDSTQSCSKCLAPCLNCFNTYLCSSCLSGILYSKQCISTCPSSTYYNSTSNACVSCTNNCLACQNVSSLCLSCSSGYYLINQTCISQCPNLYYNNQFTRICQICSSPCLNCTSATSCITCISGYYYFNSLCVSTCWSSYYADNTTNQCLPCNSTVCLTCITLNNNCLTCNTANGYFFYNKTCITACPNNTYANLIGGTCGTCPFPCSSCSNYTYCLSCDQSYVLFNNRCFSQCPITYFSDNSSKCQSCSANCQVCTSSTICLECNSNYYVFNSTCVLSCPQTYYKGLQSITNYDYCMPCPLNCLQCSSAQYCLICNTTFIQFNGLCLTSCPILYYAVNISNSYCSQCSPYCTNCINNTYCLSCIGTYLYNHYCITTCPGATYPYQGITCNPCKSPCDNCTGDFTCLTCLTGYIYFHNYCVVTCPSDVWYYPNNNSCNSNCPYNKYSAKMICYVGKCGTRMVTLNGNCLQQCSSNYYVNSNQECVICSQNPSICKDIFQADLQILYMDVLTIVLYFNQKATLASKQDISIQYMDVNSNILSKNYTSIDITQYKIQIKYDYSSISLVNVTLTIPYVQSQTTSQSINTNLYKKQLRVYNDFTGNPNPTWIIYLPTLLLCLLSVAIGVNLSNKSSHFSQVLDYVQIVAVTLYLNIQYPPLLQNFLSGFKPSLFILTKNMINLTPYTFSPPKFIYYNIDTNIFRNSLLPLLIFLIILIVFIIIISINTCRNQRLTYAVRVIRYRLLNDLFSVCLTPLLLFSCQLMHQNSEGIFVTVLLALLGVGYVAWISYKIIQIRKLSELQGLLGEFQKTQSKLGLMYIPFGYIRRIALTLGLGIAPFSPISTLTLVLVTTFLIMICVYFYEPFDNHYTDYIVIFMECSLTLYIVCLIIMGLESLPVSVSFNLAAFIVFLVSTTFVICLTWLVYLTVTDIRNKGCCPQMKKLENQNAKDDYSDSKSEKNRKKQAKQKEEERLRKLGIQPNPQQKINNPDGQQQNSANEFLRRFQNQSDQLFTDNIIHEQFKHWSEQQQSNNKQASHPNELPALLIKKQIVQQQN